MILLLEILGALVLLAFSLPVAGFIIGAVEAFNAGVRREREKNAAVR